MICICQQCIAPQNIGDNIKLHARRQLANSATKIYFPMYPPSLAMHLVNLFPMPATAFWQMV